MKPSLDQIVATCGQVAKAYPATDDSANWTIVIGDVPALQASPKPLLDRLPPSPAI